VRESRGLTGNWDHMRREVELFPRKKGRGKPAKKFKRKINTEIRFPNSSRKGDTQGSDGYRKSINTLCRKLFTI